MRESQADKKIRAQKIAEKLFELYPDPKCALNHKNPFELAIATILSAQCTDVRVNIVTTDLFKKYKSPEAFASANQSELEKDIQPTGFFRNKAKSILGFSRAIVNEYSNQIPRELKTLVKLPGVGRKTANVILGTGYGIASGVVVDTHVSRLSYRMGFTKHTDAVKIEQDLMPLIPEKDWINFSHALIWHGRRVCTARKPDCLNCALNKLCPKIGVLSAT